MTEKLIGMLRLSKKAGKLIFGSEPSANAVRSGRAHVVIMAVDASERTKKLMRNKCKSFSVPLFEIETAQYLGEKFGKCDISVLSVSDENFAKAILKILGN